MATGALFKIKPRFRRWTRAILREASKDFEGYYLKVDGQPEDGGPMEQMYLYLGRFDVEAVLEGWSRVLKETEV